MVDNNKFLHVTELVNKLVILEKIILQILAF